MRNPLNTDWKDFTIWEKLRWGNITGVVDSYDSADSVLSEDLEYHAERWPSLTHCRWRWSYNQGIWWTVSEGRPNSEQLEIIRNHLTKKYGIEWMENGYHEWEKIATKAGWIKPEEDQ